MSKTIEMEYYGLEEAAAIIGGGKLTPKTLRNRICEGKDHPPVIRPTRGVYLFPKKELHAWLAQFFQKSIA